MVQQVVTELVIDGRAAKAGADQYSTAMEKASAATQQLTAANDKAQAAIERQTVTMTQSVSRQAAQYTRLAAAADPVIAATQKLERATIAGNAALAAGAATQAEVSATLGIYRDRVVAAETATKGFAASLGGVKTLLAGFGVGLGIGALTQIPHLIMDAVKSTADMVDTADKIGVTVKALQELHYVAGQTGVDFDQMDQALSFFSKQLGAADQGSGALLKVLQQNNIALRDQHGAMRPLMDQLLDYASLIEKAGSSEERTMLVTTAFGKSADALINTLRDGPEALRSMAAEADKLGIVDDKSAAMAAKLDDQINALIFSLTALKPAAIAAASTVIGAIDSLGGAADRAWSNPSLRSILTFLDPRLARELLGSEAGGMGVINIPGAGAKQTVDAMQTIIDKSKDFDVAFGDTASAIEEIKQGMAKLHPEAGKVAKAIADIPLPRLRPEPVDRLGEAFKTVTAHAQDFTDTLVQGLMRGDSLTATLADSLTSLSSSLATSAIKDLMGGNFLGAAVSGIGALITGIFGHNEEEKKQRDEARKAWAAMAGDVAAFSVRLSGAVESNLGTTINQARLQFIEFAKAAQAAGVDVSGLRQQFVAFRAREIADFRKSFSGELAGLRFGDAVAQGAQAVAALREQLLGFVADTRRAFSGQGPTQVNQALQAGRTAVLRNLGPQTDVSEFESEFRRLQGARAESIQLLHDLGVSLANATREVNTRIRASVADLRRNFIGDLQAQINEATGHGVFNEIQALVKQNLQQLHDAQILGVNASLVNRSFQAQAQAVIDNERLTGNAFDALIARFPQLRGVVHEFTGTIEDAATRLERINGVAKSIVEYVNNLRAGSASTLSPQDRLTAAQASYVGQITLAQGGNLDAQAGITKYADDLLSAARALYASSQGYQDIFATVTSQLIGLPAVQATTDPVVIALRDAIIAIQGTTDAVTAQTAALVLAINAGPQATATALIPQFDRIAGSDHVIDFTEFTAALHGLATEATLQAMFTALDLDGNGVISRLETQLSAEGLNHAALVAAINGGPVATANALAPHFSTLDTNVNGLLDLGELRTALGPLATNAQLLAIYSELDLNGNGTISRLDSLLTADGLTRTALVNAINAGPGATAAALEPHFNALDTNVNGLLDVNELRAAISPLASNAQIQALIARVDTNGDGQISKMELVRAASVRTATSTGTIAVNTGATVTNTNALNTLSTAIRANSRLLGQQFQSGTLQLLRFADLTQHYLSYIEVYTWYMAKSVAAVGANPTIKPGNITLPGGAYASHGGIVGQLAPGGIVGNGFWNVDSVRARYAGGGDIMLAGGEGVINAAATRLMGPSMIDLINRTGRLPANDNGPHFATQNRVLATGFNAVVTELRRACMELANMRERLDALERRARIEASREPRRKTGTDG